MNYSLVSKIFNKIYHKIGYIYFLGGTITLLAASNNSLIKWKDDYQITKNDFKGKIDKLSKFQANTNTSIKIKISIDDTIKTDVNAYFDKQKSWLKPETPESVIKHENLHFAITEIYAREIRKRIKEIKVNNNEPKTQKIQITNAYQTFLKRMALEQELYDKETQHSANNIKQIEWNNTIAKKLNSLSNYK